LMLVQDVYNCCVFKVFHECFWLLPLLDQLSVCNVVHCVRCNSVAEFYLVGP
jgi:hypothetical protein